MVEEACQIRAPVCSCWSVWSLKAVQSDDACLLNLNTYSIAYVCAGAAAFFWWDWDWNGTHLREGARASACYLLLFIDDPFDFPVLFSHMFLFYYMGCFPLLSVLYCILCRWLKFEKFFLNRIWTQIPLRKPFIFVFFQKFSLIALRVIGNWAKLIRSSSSFSSCTEFLFSK